MASTLQGRRLNAYNIWILLFVSLGSLSYGYAASVIVTTLGQPSFVDYFELNSRPDGTVLLAATNGIFQAGGVLGTLLLPYFSDRWGRKAGLLLSSVLVVISGAALAGSVNIAMFLVFRFSSGFGTFMMLAAVPTWMTEVVPPCLRGALVNINAVSLMVGYVTSSWVGYGIYFWEPSGRSNAWRVPLALQPLWPLMLLAGLYWVPESPRWLIANNYLLHAEKVLIRLHKDVSDPSDSSARAELHQIQKQITADRDLDKRWISLFQKPSLIKRMLLTCGTTGFVQASGVLVINNYGPTLYRSLGESQSGQLLLPAARSTMALGMNVISSLVVDRVPRNVMLSIGMAACVVFLIIEAALVANFEGTSNRAGLTAAVAVLFLFEIPYEFCLDGVQFTYISELWPNHLRAKGISIGVAMFSLANIVFLQAAPTAFQTIGWRFYLVLIIPASVGAVLMWVVWPDTKNRPLEEIAAIFGDQEVEERQGEVVEASKSTPGRIRSQSTWSQANLPSMASKQDA